MDSSHYSLKRILLHPAVLVSALGYFVDIYDLILFSIIRTPSLQSLGLSQKDVFEQGVFLLNMQMFGMLLGGLLWGILGDKKGRLSVLFGSIIMYSLANIANGFVHTVHSYALLRLIAGIGLSGELGAGITLVAESLPQSKRGIGTTVVATVGILGAILAVFVGKNFDWRTAYYFGGALGLLLLTLRMGVVESGMFIQTKKTLDLFRNCHERPKCKEPRLQKTGAYTPVCEDFLDTVTPQFGRALNFESGLLAARGQWLRLFTHTSFAIRYLRCIFIGVPIWFVVGLLLTFSPELAKHTGVLGPIDAGHSILYGYIGLTLGDLLSGLLSQQLKSRKKTVFIFISMLLMCAIIYLHWPHLSVFQFYGVCFLLGVTSGYWAVFMTIATEQFGTNLRATVTTTVPNFVRGAVVPITLCFKYLAQSHGMIQAASMVLVVVFSWALVATFYMEDTYHKDLNFLE